MPDTDAEAVRRHYLAHHAHTGEAFLTLTGDYAAALHEIDALRAEADSLRASVSHGYVRAGCVTPRDPAAEPEAL